MKAVRISSKLKTPKPFKTPRTPYPNGNDLDFMFDIPEIGKKQTSFLVPGPQLTKRDIYLFEEFDNKTQHIENLNIIRNASEFEDITLWLSNDGGLLDVAVEYYDAISSSDALVTANIGSACSSAATMVAMACSDWRITPFSSFMIHSVAYGSGGRDHEVRYQTQFQAKQNEKFIRLIYTGFLSEEEIQQVQEGRPLYFGSDELVERFAKYSAFRAEQAEQEVEAENNASTATEETQVVLKKAYKQFDLKRGDKGYTDSNVVGLPPDAEIPVVFGSSIDEIIVPIKIADLTLVQ